MSRFSFQLQGPGSSSGPFLNLTKNFGDLFRQAEGLGSSAVPAMQTFGQLGEQLNNLFQNYGAGQRAAINQRFDIEKNNALGSLAKRGFSGSSLAASTGSAAERDRSLALGSFEDSLLGQRIGATQKVYEGIAGAQMGQADLSQRLREALLGLDQSQSIANTGGGGGGGSGGGGSSYLDDSRRSFDEFRKRFEGGTLPAPSGGGGGGGSSGGGGGGGSPAMMENPFAAPKAGEVPAWAGQAKELGGFSSTGPPGTVGETYVVGGLTCTVTQNKGNYSYRTCVPTSALEQQQQEQNQPPATGGIPGDLGDYGTVA